jgi:hypothetical protein
MRWSVPVLLGPWRRGHRADDRMRMSECGMRNLKAEGMAHGAPGIRKLDPSSSDKAGLCRG